MPTRIEWAGETLGLWVGCNNPPDGGDCSPWCYAQGQANRFAKRYAETDKIEFGPAHARPGLTFVPTNRVTGETLGKGARWTGRVWAYPAQFLKPLRWKQPRVIFPNSQSDFFHEGLTSCDEGRRVIAAAFGLMGTPYDARTPGHRWQVLTKRPEGAREWFEWLEREAAGRDPMSVCYPELLKILNRVKLSDPDAVPERLIRRVGSAEKRRNWAEHNDERDPWPLSNVLIGTSVENGAAVSRIDRLRQVPAAARFLSIEPLLEDLGVLNLTGIDWVIVGGASGHKATPMHPDWIRSIRDQCEAASVPLFVKQWGEFAPVSDDDDAWTHFVTPSGVTYKRGEDMPMQVAASITGSTQAMRRVGKGNAGRELDGKVHDAMPPILTLTEAGWAA